MPIHEVLYESPWVVCPFRESLYRARYQVHYLCKVHPVCLLPPSANVYPPSLCQDCPICSLHMAAERGCRYPPPHSSQLTLFFFCLRNVSPSPIPLLLYATVPCWPQMKPRLHTIALVLPIFFCSPTLSNILTISVVVICTHKGFCPAMWPFSA